jgi:hypothetical protein
MMHATLSIFSILRLTFLFASSVLAQYPKSPKRGLVSVSTLNPGDDQIFVQPNNGLTWYYNYGISLTTEYKNLTQSEIEFVPMLWGISNATGNTFLQNVTSMIAKGRNITHVLSFNEPDVNYTAGGSQISPDAAAASWILNFDPLRKMGIKVGAPVVYANESGFAWLDKFYTACESRKSNCTADFMNIHVFGNISFVESYLTEYKQKSVSPVQTVWTQNQANLSLRLDIPAYPSGSPSLRSHTPRSRPQKLFSINRSRFSITIPPWSDIRTSGLSERRQAMWGGMSRC